jgi:proline iminopeptidase
VTTLLVRDVSLQIVAPTLVIAGRSDSILPPEHRAELATGIPKARLRIVERAGQSAHSERPAAVVRALRRFLSVEVAPVSASASVRS